MPLARKKKESKLEVSKQVTKQIMVTKEVVDTDLINDIKHIVNFLYPDKEVKAAIHIGNILLSGGIAKKDLPGYVNISSTAVYSNRATNRESMEEVEEMVSKMIKLKHKLNEKL